MIKVLAVMTFVAGATAAFPAVAEEVGDLVRPKGDLPLREAPPGLFLEKGAQVGVAVPSEYYRIVERKSVPTLLGLESWKKVQAAGDPKKSGWIFTGPSSNPSANISRIGN
jgi:hypothetical protein